MFMTSFAVNVITWHSGTLLRAQHNHGFGHNNKTCKIWFHSHDYYYECYCTMQDIQVGLSVEVGRWLPACNRDKII